MNEVVARYQREYMTYHRITPKRQRDSIKKLSEFELSLNGRSLIEATGNDLQAFAGAEMNRGLNVNTVRKYLNMLRPFFSWAYAAGVITPEQYLDLKRVKDPRGSTAHGKPTPYTQVEVREFWATLDARWELLPDKGQRSKALSRWLSGKGPWRKVWRHAMRLQLEAMVRLALDLGLRRAEIFNLSVDDLHYDNEYIVIRGKADPNTGDPQVRWVPFTHDARDALYNWLEFRALMRPEHERPWLSCHGATAAKPMLWSRFELLLQKTVGPQWRWHRFRHTCATEWLRAGAEIENVKELLGHANIAQTLCYAQILKADVAKNLGRVEGDFSQAVRRAA